MASKAPGTGAKKPAAKTPAPVKPKAAAPVAKKTAAPKPEAAPAPVVEAAKPVIVAEPVAEIAQVTAETVSEVTQTAAETFAEAAAPVAEIIKDTAPQMADTATKGTDIMETTIEKTQAFFADFNDRAKAAVEKNTKLAGEFTDFAKGNVEALVESGKIAAKGFEALGQDAAEYSRKSFENATATLKSLAAVKSPADFFKLQSDYARSTFDSLVAETSKNTEAFIKLAGDAAQPVSNRFAVAVEKVKTAA
ncbi:phasin family protein [Sphingomonas sp. BT-65]|uniref:phasin family protein n=1 Tax=Sphingomonas sp. BT-65 TaxID=2989821 RepID=UPI00223675F0|nr:phasin family protein [Sphingomonas sp. BT-65]MCW4461550.1 phasin family protein [Sphingomonas sp. BT-65]